MGRPLTSLLVRCCEATFRPRHHWPLVAREADLPVARLAALQQQARQAEPDRQRTLAREFNECVRDLDDLERARLRAARAEMERPHQPSNRVGRPATTRTALPPAPLAGRLDAALAEVLQQTQVELSAAELFQRDLLIAAVEQLDRVRAEIAHDGLTIPGSRGQLRAHPLLTLETKLTADLAKRLREFTNTVRHRANRELPMDEVLRLITPRS